MSACLLVRAQLQDVTIKAQFERWYREEHLPQACTAFRATRAWRGWSDVEPLVHYAYYELPDLEAARALRSSAALARMVAEFDRMWAGKVARSRDYLEIAQQIPG